MLLIGIILALQDAPPPTVTVQIPQAVPDAKVLRMTDAQICDMAKQVSATLQRDLPLQVDAITRTDAMGAVCGAKMVYFNRFMSVAANQLREGWQGRKGAQFSQIICENTTFRAMIYRGWRFTMTTTLASGEIFHQDASCGG